MLSLFGPRHGRILQADFDTSQKLNVRVTRIFSFLKKDSAPLDLFLRILASTPRRDEDLKLYPEVDTNYTTEFRLQSAGLGKENIGPNDGVG